VVFVGSVAFVGGSQRGAAVPAARATAAASYDKVREVIMLPSWVRLLIAGYRELIAVLAAAVLGLTVQAPLAWLAARQGINILLAALVFATALTIQPAAQRAVPRGETARQRRSRGLLATC
jgi:hypothetical protein